jgi:hypothetical protein
VANHPEPEPEPSNVVTPVFGGPREVASVESDELDTADEAPSYRWDDEVAEESADEQTDEPADEPGAVTDEVDEPERDDNVTGDDETETAVAESAATEDEPVREPSSLEVEEDFDDWGDDPLGASVASYDEPAEPVAEVTPEPELEPASVTPLAPVASAAGTNGSVPPGDGPVRLTIRRPLSATPAAAALESENVPDGGPLNTPIFGQLRSNWLNDGGDAWADDEVDRGWTAADRAENADAEAEGHTRTGLPVRRPGGRLVPGGVSTEPTVVARDPDAIRNRLAAHAAGVSRGRAAAAAQPVSNDYAHEETGPA